MQITNHPVTEESVMAYFDGELAPEGAAGMAAHLERCEECRAVAADLQSVSRHLCSWNLDAANLEMSQRLKAELDSGKGWGPESKQSCFGWVADHRAVAAISAGVIVVLGGLLITISKSGHTPAFASRMSLPAQGGNLAEFSQLESVPGRPLAAQKSTFVQSGPVVAPNRPLLPVLLIIRTAELSLTSRDFGTVRRDIESVLRKYQGHIAQLNVNTPSGQARSLDATLRIPAAQLDAALNELRRLGHVDSESQRGEEVTQRYTDIEARLANALHTEQRLTAILQGRTAKLSDVLAVEEQLARVRGEIETTEAEQKSLANQIELATVQLRVTEEFKQALEVGRTGLLTRVRNAAIEGIQAAADGVVGLVLWLLSTGPSLLLIGILLFFPLRWIWKHRTVERR